MKRFFFRSCLNQLKERPVCHFVGWANTFADEFLCSHCLHLGSSELFIDDYHQSGYCHFLRTTPRYRLQVRENVREVYEEFFVVFDWLGDIELEFFLV